MLSLKLELIILLSLNCCYLSTGIPISTTFFIRDELSDVIFQHAFLEQTGIRKDSDCAFLCLSSGNCASFQIHEQLLLCRLYWTHFLLDAIGSPSAGPCNRGYFYTRMFQYCFRYAGHTFSKNTAFDTCNDRNETLLKIDSTEENLFVSSLAYSFINNTLGSRSFEMIIDGERLSGGTWNSLFGNNEILTFTNFPATDVASVNERIVITPPTNGELKGYEWKSVSLLSNQRTTICRYYP
ncbi:uncharacterized protein LOC134242336 [Saccostrea cucullata]|uniref:uncharacterized protein LOC134242336 n=1 Tax=Saccostrea cuccullata TaxID=36930 RepID=UPI002ED626A8